jgi:iron complex outermembrane recepter protein
MMRARNPLVVIGLALPVSLLAEPALASGDEIELDTITVKGEAMHRNDVPTTVNRVEASTFENEVMTRPEDALKDVPGVEIGNYNMGGVANVVKMRGFSNGAHGGDVAIFVDGIPLNEGESHADGYADMNVLIPLEIEELEVYKGPSTALFGNFARAGSLAFHTRQRGEYTKARVSDGSFDSLDTQAAFGVKLGEGIHNNTAIQGARSSGFQDHSDWSRINGSTRFTWDIRDGLELALSLRAHESDWDAPGYIPKSMFDAESTAQAPNAEDDGGKKTFYSERVDLGWSLNEQVKLLYWVYGTQQDFTRFAKFGYEPGGQTERNYDRQVWGTGASLNVNTQLAQKPLTAVVGTEYYNEDTAWLRWNTSNRKRLSLREDRDFNITTFSVFGQAEWELSRYFRPTLGLRYDAFGGQYDNQDPGSTPFERDMNDYDAWSPKAGFRSLVADGVDLRASYSEGFSLPDGEAKYQTDIDVEPETVQQYEIGLNYKPNDRLLVDVAGFILDTSDEIHEIPIDSGNFENLGKTRRTGVEAEIRFEPITGLTLFGDVTMIDSEVLTSDDASLEGNAVVGVPRHVLNLGAEYSSPQGFGGRVKWRQVGKYYIDEANTETYDGYDTVDLGVFYEHKLNGDGRTLRLGFDVLNLFDQWYSQAVWTGYGTTNYAVSWPRTYWLSANLNW